MSTIAVLFSSRILFILMTICLKNILYHRIYFLSLRSSFRGRKWDFIWWKSITVWRIFGQTIWNLFDISKIISFFFRAFLLACIYFASILYNTYSHSYFCLQSHPFSLFSLYLYFSMFCCFFSQIPLHLRVSPVIVMFSSPIFL